MENKQISYQMQLYVVLVRTGSFTRAAEQLGITRSWLSQQISALEKSLNTLLLQRTTRTLRMTASGESFFEHALAIENLLEKAYEDIVSTQSLIQGKIRISCPFAFTEVIAIPVIKTLRLKHSQLSAELVVTDEIQDLLKDNIDVAIRVGTLPDSNLKARYLGSFKQCWYQSPHSTEADTYQILLPWQTSNHPSSIRVNNILTAAEMAKQGLGRVLLPDIFALRYCEDGLLQEHPDTVEKHQQKQEVHAIHGYSEFTPSRIRIFIESIRDQFDIEMQKLGKE